MSALVADLDQRDAIGPQAGGGLAQQPPHQVHAVGAAGQRQLGLVAELQRQLAHRSRIDVGRVAQQQVDVAGQLLQQIRALQPHARRVQGDVGRGDLERVGRNVTAPDVGVRPALRGQDRQAAAAGADVDDAPRRRRQPRLERVVEQLGDEGARHDDALVDDETLAVQPRLADQVGGRAARLDARVQQGPQPLQRRLGHRATAQPRQLREAVEHGPAQRVNQHPRRLLRGVLGALAVLQPGALQPRGGVAPDFVESRLRHHATSAASVRR
ncbi:hypothetical protein GALL_348220 [mine drainage metagenome]|uniref:Uncharacterized protein n=1 Tax=mine drainage metagenome TaxID=410659 RepID=A0A1J5QIP8_9ZZZZ